jgi:hypothetical protein
MNRSIAMNRWNSSRSSSRHSLNAGAPFFLSPATTLAICVMVFGVLHAVATASAERVTIDVLLGINASLYIAAAVLAKFALHVRESMHCFRLARYANNFSMAGLYMTIAGTCCLVLVAAFNA